MEGTMLAWGHEQLLPPASWHPYRVSGRADMRVRTVNNEIGDAIDRLLPCFEPQLAPDRVDGRLATPAPSGQPTGLAGQIEQPCGEPEANRGQIQTGRPPTSADHDLPQ
jgi:hypothetical protein